MRAFAQTVFRFDRVSIPDVRAPRALVRRIERTIVVAIMAYVCAQVRYVSGELHAVSTAIGDGMAPPTTTFRSRSGAYWLSVSQDPLLRDMGGRGPAEYLMRKDGEILWTKKLPYTLRFVAVLENGRIAGVAYRDAEGPELERPETRASHLHVVVLGQGGDEAMNEVFGRRAHYEIRDPPGMREPFVNAMIVDETNQRMLLWVVVYEEGHGSADQVWSYDLAERRLLSTFKLADLAPTPDDHVRVCETLVMRGADLVVIHAIVYHTDAGARGAVFLVVDSKARLVWQRHMQDDYVDIAEWAGRTRGWRPRHCEHFKSDPAFGLSDAPGSFWIRSFRGDRFVRLVVNRAATGEWAVTEVP